MNQHIRAQVRPDGRLYVRCVDRWTPAAAREAASVASEHRGSTVVSVGGDDAEALAALEDAGFRQSREEAVVSIALAAALRALTEDHEPSELEMRSAADVDEDRLRELDDELRQDVPGSSGWSSSPEEFRAHTFDDPAFDPRTYLVAIAPSGELAGLVRIWMNQEGPRLGFLGVRREVRRRGIGRTLLRHALAAVEAQGRTDVVTDFDVRNEASRSLADRLGARRIGTRLELVFEPGVRERGARNEEANRVA
jgi:ribosomal protein S18 acetylase RimI-like enzyme